MTDPLTPEQRRRTMQAVKGQDTGPELALYDALTKLGIEGARRHDPTLAGKPDFVFPERMIAVFVDGGFWHGRPDRYWTGRSGSYWDAKIARNKARDARVNEELRQAGWTVLRFWDSDVAKDAMAVARAIEDALRSACEEQPGGRGLARVAEARPRYESSD